MSRNEDAERVARQISEYVQRLVGVIGPVEQEFCAQSLCPLALPLQLSRALDREVNVQLHRDIVLRPCRPRQVLDLLEGELPRSCGVHEHEPIRIVGRPVRGRLVTGSVLEPEQQPVELGELSRSRGVENGVQQLGYSAMTFPSVKWFVPPHSASRQVPIAADPGGLVGDVAQGEQRPDVARQFVDSRIHSWASKSGMLSRNPQVKRTSSPVTTSGTTSRIA